MEGEYDIFRRTWGVLIGTPVHKIVDEVMKYSAYIFTLPEVA
jgi:hypothetical protein